HLNGIVRMMAPERLPELMDNLAAASLQLDPHVMIQVLRGDPGGSGGAEVVNGVAGAFDDGRVAQLLATALALDGKASDRLATIFSTIAPDADRKRRVLTLTRSLLSETDFGRAGQFQTLWTSMEELLVSYNDKAFVSDSYRTALDGVGVRADHMAAADLPPELPEWMESLGQNNVRRLSVTMLIDLLAIEQEPDRTQQIADDMEAVAEDLLMAGAYGEALTVAQALADRAAGRGGAARDACRRALDRLGESLALRETAALIGDLDADTWQSIQTIVRAIGSVSIEALKPVLAAEHDTLATARAEELLLEV